ncbi:MAG: hypothetical protein PHP54_03515 [Clostridia bacterium]|nr:hypothetical protein [Clostridia bacterium]
MELDRFLFREFNADGRNLNQKIKALRNIQNTGFHNQVALTSQEPRLQIISILKITDQNILLYLSEVSQNERVRRYASDRLEELARNVTAQMVS